MLGNWPFWCAYVGTGTLLVLLAWLGSRRRRLSPKQLAAGGIPAACGSCGYDLTGLPGTTCPECGSDLDLVGRISPQFRRWAAVPVTARLIVWTVVVAAVGTGLVFAALSSGLGQRQRFIGMIQWVLRAPLTDSRDRPRSLDYNMMMLTIEARFERPVDPGKWLSARSEITPEEGTRWTAATIRVDRFSRPSVTEDSQAYFWPGAAGGGAGSSVFYLEPGNDGGFRLSPASRGVISGAEEPKLRELLKVAIEQSGYGGEFGSPEELVAPIESSATSFIDFGAPIKGEGPSAWYGNHHGVRESFATAVQPIEIEPVFPAVAAGIWLVVWLCGLPFILPSRPLSIRSDTVLKDAKVAIA